LAPCRSLQKIHSSQPGSIANFGSIPDRNCDFGVDVFREVGLGLRLFRIKSEGLELPAPFGWRITEPLDADAAGQATLYGGLDKVGREEGE
jgi:hypothetical protein